MKYTKAVVKGIKAKLMKRILLLMGMPPDQLLAEYASHFPGVTASNYTERDLICAILRSDLEQAFPSHELD